MEFRFSEEEESFRREIREFVKKNIPYEHFGHKFEEEHDDAAWDFAMSISKKLAEKKWLTITWPKEHGGMGAPLWQQAVFREEVGYWGIPGTTMGVSGTSWVGPSLMLFGSEELKKTHLPLIASGEPDGVWCTGYSEPDSGTDLASLQTRAERDGDEYVINGQKVWTSCAHRARWFWLACRTKADVEKKHRGLSIIIVDMKSDGVKVQPIKNLVGLHAFNEVFLNDVRVPITNLVGVENNGWSQLMTALSFERGNSINYCGLHRRLRDELLIYARKSGAVKNPEVRKKLVELSLDIETLKTLTYETMWKMNRGDKIVYEPSRDKAFTDTVREKMTRIGLELLNIYGMMDPLKKDAPWVKLNGALEHLYYTAPGLAVAAGTTYTQRNIVAQFGMQLPRSY